MLTLAITAVLFAALWRAIGASGASVHLRAQARHAAPAPTSIETHASNARNVLRAARQSADVDVVRAAVAEHRASAHAANESDAEFEMVVHRVTQLNATDWLRIGAALAALVTFAYATYQIVAAVRRYRGSTTKMSVPIDHKIVQRLRKSAAK